MTATRLLQRIPVPPAWLRAWDGLSSRERKLAASAAAVVLLAAGWGFIWQPMQEDTDRAREEGLRDRAALAVARAQAAEMAGLQRSAPAAPAGDPRLPIERVLAERSLKATVTSLEIKDNRAFVTFGAIGFDALVGALDALAKADGLRAVEATLTARVDPGTVRAELTLAR
jgi:type II secretory pathway component PulM